MCVLSCPQRLPAQQERWCPTCRDEYERWLDQGGELAALALAHREADACTPATESEWLAHLEDMAPLIEDLAQIPASMECPLCRGAKSIGIEPGALPFPVETRRPIPIPCPWCSGLGEVPDLPEWYYPELAV